MGVSEVGSTNAQASWEIVPGWMWWESCVPYIEMGVGPRRDGRVAVTVPYNAMYGTHRGGRDTVPYIEMGGRVDVPGGAASQRWLSLVPLPPSILPQSLSLDLTFLATVVLVLTALSLFFNLPTRKPN